MIKSILITANLMNNFQHYALIFVLFYAGGANAKEKPPAEFFQNSAGG